MTYSIKTQNVYAYRIFFPSSRYNLKKVARMKRTRTYKTTKSHKQNKV